MPDYTAVPCARQRAHHAEGPVWDHTRDELVWVDIYEGLIHRAAWEDGELHVTHTHAAGQAVGAVVPCADPGDGWIVATEFGFSRLHPDGTFTAVAEPERGHRPPTRMNDGKCDPLGRFWAGSMANDRTPGAGTLHCLSADVSRPAIHGVTISNGLAWTAPDAFLYIDTPAQCVERVRVGADGRVASRGVAFEIAPELGAPDGMTIDEAGGLWIAMWGTGTVLRFTQDGEVTARVTVPARQVSSCCFGGPDLRTLFITTSQENYTARQSAAEPNAGLLFAADVCVRGRPADLYVPGGST
ncbi:SMP-30/gluconolactonase/LRE family protein [Actinomadura sp. LD22]|uniref:SMP-30/gluconolactonase/LRE family protein n=1 Tax=Actinomadura physcomitrii TaxID=2650748 RepID=A0A6I4MG35_9ACTN|nr:SMP-30/gluconolactonase/LRE family protein [Actinomadura physcomitrii]MWA02691.1 SMP-30/gluconolactonase/LRE family protein [Actinomadura physcomitrii]